MRAGRKGNAHHKVLCRVFDLKKNEDISVLLCILFCSCATWGILCVTPVQPSLFCPVHFYFSGSAVSDCTFPHCYLSSTRKQLQFLLDVFLCLLCFCSFQCRHRRKKQINGGHMCVYFVSPCLCVSKHCVVVRGLCEGGFLPINQTQRKQTFKLMLFKCIYLQCLHL